MVQPKHALHGRVQRVQQMGGGTTLSLGLGRLHSWGHLGGILLAGRAVFRGGVHFQWDE
jgi:hypothetical protein